LFLCLGDVDSVSVATSLVPGGVGRCSVPYSKRSVGSGIVRRFFLRSQRSIATAVMYCENWVY